VIKRALRKFIDDELDLVDFQYLVMGDSRLHDEAAQNIKKKYREWSSVELGKKLKRVVISKNVIE